MLSCGLVGLPMVGKTTLFNLLTKASVETSRFFSGKTETHIGLANIVDKRVNQLSKIYSPRKTVYAQLQVIDVVGLVRGASSGEGVGNQFIEQIRKVEALVHVIRAFRNEEILHVDETVDPVRDFQTINVELLLADLGFVEKRIQRIKEGKKVRQEQQREIEVLEKVYDHLSEEKPFHTLELSCAEELLLQSYTFLTEKPMIVVVNVDDEQYQSDQYPKKRELEALVASQGIPILMLSAQLESDMAALDGEAREALYQELGIQTQSLEKLSAAMYGLLGRISFFTVGEDEVRAWTITKGLTAKQAAGKIHSDLERGFIRAETVHYDDFESAGSMAEAKARGVWRLEGKDYIVRDGDILTIRFNV